MKTRFSLVILIIVFSFHLGFSQEPPKILPPSPEVASFGKFTEVPVSHYTGVPNISIPISSFDVDGKSFPVSLSYHARGVKVEEIASRLGIGWALNAGGAISRQTRGQPDDGSGGYINRSNILMDALANGTFFTDSIVRNDYHTADAYASVQPDRFPDQFSLSAGSLSAKFIFNYVDDQPLIQSFNDIVIEYSLGNVQSPAATNIIKSFVVTDKDGFRYYFGTSKDGLRQAQNWDKNIGNYSFPANSSYNLTSSTFELNYNSWLLMDVESPNGALVSFVYDEETSVLHRRSYDKKDGLGIYTNYTSKIESHQYQLKEILHEGGKVEFVSTTNRQDLNGGKELDQVKIYDNNLDLVKTFQLYQSYPATVVDGNQNSQLKALETQAAKRMFLDSIVEIGKNNLKKPAHVFTYNEQALPNRFSNSQDLWGFYNGDTNGEFLKFFGSASEVNRQVDVEKSMAGMLEKIKYPTGGSTKFVFEHNIGKLGTEYDSIVLPDVNAIEAKSAIISHFDHASYTNGQYEKNVDISNIAGPLSINVNLPTLNGVNHNWACGDPIQNDCGFDISLVGINGNPYSYHYIFSGQQEFYVESGEYKLIFDPDQSLNWNPTPPNTPPFSVSLSWEAELVSGNYLYSAGKRIKRIEFYDSADNLVSQKVYEYKNLNGNESGVILSVPAYGSLQPDSGLGNGLWQPAAAVPGSSFTTFQSNTIGYEMVTEYHGTETNNHGKTQYNFLVNKDSGDYMSYPVTASTDNEWLRGLPRHIYHYNNSSGTYKLVKYIYNEYHHADQYLLPLIFTPLSKRLPLEDDWPDPGSSLINEGLHYDKTDTFFRLPLINLFVGRDENGGLDAFDLNYKIYHLTGGTLSNYKSTETLYDDNENPTVITETETEYNYQKHYQPALVKTVTSDGMPVIQTFTYPQDIVSSYTIHPQNYSTNPTTALAEQHRVVPLTVKQYKDADDDGTPDIGELLNTTETTYAWDGSVLEPSLVQTGKGVNPTLVDRVNFIDYDSDGNLLQVSKAEGTDITYIYGYDKTLPVAKIENATYAQVSSQVTNIQNLSNLDDDHCLDSGTCDEKNLRTALTALRNSLPNAMVTTYTYDPLIGVTSITDPKGYTTYYIYDDLNRLQQIKDADGNILSENEYYYSGSQQP